MAKDFFGSLGETITKTARELSGRAEEVYETQRILDVVSKRTAITSGRGNEKKYHKMSRSEMHDLYGG